MLPLPNPAWPTWLWASSSLSDRTACLVPPQGLDQADCSFPAACNRPDQLVRQNWDAAGWSNAPSWPVQLLTYRKMSQPWAQATSSFENHKHTRSHCFLQSLALGIHTSHSFGSARSFSWKSSQLVFSACSSFCQGYFSAASHHITTFLFIYISQLGVKVFYLFRYPKN